MGGQNQGQLSITSLHTETTLRLVAICLPDNKEDGGLVLMKSALTRGFVRDLFRPIAPPEL